MSVMNLGRVKGNSWYIGDLITGKSTTPTAFPASGVSYAIIGDVYLNVTGDDRGHVYQCDTAGDPDDALWVFVGTILGPMPEVVNNLESTSTTKALSAAMGKKLNDLLDTYGLQPYVVTPTSGAVAYTAAVVIEDKDTTFTVTDIEGNTGTHSHTEAGGTQVTVNITIGTSIGLPDNGAVIKSIKSSGAKIFSYKLYDSTSTEIFSETPSLWDHITNDELNIVPYSDITEGANTYKSGLISKIISGIRTTLYPVTHAKAVFFDKENNQNVYDRMVADETSLGVAETSLGKAVANTPWYGSCSTAAATAAKVATTADTMIGTLAAGMKVSILFEHENTAADPTLNVDGNGAIPIVAFGTTAPTVSWKDGEVVNFIYDGTSWIMGATAGQVEKITSDLSELDNPTPDIIVDATNKTYAVALNEVFAQIDFSKITYHTHLRIGGTIAHISVYNVNNYIEFSSGGWGNHTTISSENFILLTDGSQRVTLECKTSGNTLVNNSNANVGSNIYLYY